MGGKSLRDAGVATDSELDEIAAEAGLFATAEATTMSGWVGAGRATWLQQLRKTRSELNRLEASLARLEHISVARFGAPMISAAFAAEFAALEGWTLTLIANYVALAGLDDRYEKTQRFQRAKDFLQGAIEEAWTHSRARAMVLQKKVLETLSDRALIFPRARRASLNSNSKSRKFSGFANQQKSDSGLGCSS